MAVKETPKKFQAGDVIMRQGAPGHCAYIIEKGRVEILIERESEEPQSVGTRGPGTMIGEMALVDNANRTATVRAVEDCELLEISKEDFQRRLDTSDPVLKMTTQVILTRYRDTLLRSKIAGENKSWPPVESVELMHAENSNAVESIKIANEFKDALKRGEVTLHYQPIVNLESGKIDGFEALMRWEHPEKGMISPGVFIPIIEDSGIIVEASQWALDESCKALKRIEQHTGDHGRLFMSVNFSSTDFASDSFVDKIYNIISLSDLKPEQIHLEITERILMGQPDNARETLSMCTKAGMGISIDDFGTGYSSLSYLHYFPIDTLKIDQSFVRDMLKNDSSLELVRSVVILAKNLGMKVIAEGVEEKAEGQKLHELGCDNAQGYFYAKPMAEKALVEMIRNWNAADYH